MKREYTAIPKWNKARQIWRIQPTINGNRGDFTSSIKGRNGQLECYAKADAWAKTMDLEGMTIPTAWPLFMDWYKKTVKETSAKKMDDRGKAHLVRAYPHKLIKDFKKSDWQGILDRAYANGAKSRATLKGIASTIKSFTRWCATQDIISDHAVPLYFAMPTQATTGTKTIMQPDQLKFLFTSDAEDDPFIHCYRFIVLTGLRRGEFCALQRDRDFDGQQITVRESISHDSFITDGKSKEKNSVKILTELALEQIRAHEEAHGTGKFLFVSPYDKRQGIRPRHLSDMWREWRERHGVKLTLHELRHTFISYTRLKSDISLEELKKLYGHTKDMDTDRVYVHAIDKSPDEIREEQAKAEANALQINKLFLTILDPNSESVRECSQTKAV